MNVGEDLSGGVREKAIGQCVHGFEASSVEATDALEGFVLPAPHAGACARVVDDGDARLRLGAEERIHGVPVDEFVERLEPGVRVAAGEYIIEKHSHLGGIDAAHGPQNSFAASR